MKNNGALLFIILIFSTLTINFALATNGCNANDVECGSTPTDNCNVRQNTIFNSGTYNISNGVDICANNVVLDCNGTTLIE